MILWSKSWEVITIIIIIIIPLPPLSLLSSLPHLKNSYNTQKEQEWGTGGWTPALPATRPPKTTVKAGG
jgi:hypothetical protein